MFRICGLRAEVTQNLRTSLGRGGRLLFASRPREGSQKDGTRTREKWWGIGVVE